MNSRNALPNGPSNASSGLVQFFSEPTMAKARRQSSWATRPIPASRPTASSRIISARLRIILDSREAMSTKISPKKEGWIIFFMPEATSRDFFVRLSVCPYECMSVRRQSRYDSSCTECLSLLILLNINCHFPLSHVL